MTDFDNEDDKIQESSIRNAEIERQYANILSDLLAYICKKKIQNREEPIVNIITDFCFKNNLEPELVGDAIREDYYMYDFVMKDCVANKIDRFSYTNAVTELEDW